MQGGREEEIKARLGKVRGAFVKEDVDQAIQNIGQTSSHVWLRNMENERR